MKCPECREELEYINAFGECRQKATLDKDGNVISWGSVDEVYETVYFECKNCGGDLTSLVKT